MKFPADIKANAEAYIELTTDTIESLSFLLDNLGNRFELDLSPASVALVEEELVKAHRHPNPDELFPELIESFAQLLAQYCALVCIDLCDAGWGIDDTPSSAFFGQPYVDVVPTEPWRRYFPIHWQRVLRNSDSVFGASYRPLSRLVDDCRKAREQYELLVEAVTDVVLASPSQALLEEDIHAACIERGIATTSGMLGVGPSRFPKRLAAILRKSGRFSKHRKDKTWKLKRGFEPHVTA